MNYVKGWVIRLGIRSLMAAYLFLLWFVKIVGLKKREINRKEINILLTGVFYSDNWIIPHLRPLAGSICCKRVFMVSEVPVPTLDKVQAVYPPACLVRILGGDIARLLTFMWVCVHMRPEIVGGFHLLVNGLVAVLLAKVIGSRSLYICGGGPREVIGGGYTTENRIFSKLSNSDRIVERMLLESVKAFDLVITMGSGAIRFFRDRGVNTVFHIVPGGFDGNRFYPSIKPASTDLILVGRLSSVKRVDLLLYAIRILKMDLPDVVLTIVGDGPLRDSLEWLANKLGIEQNVKFVGQQKHVEQWLRRSKIFVLTSESEGLSLAMIEAMLCGLPAIVSDVGDLNDMVKPGVNGYLVSDRNPESFAKSFKNLLTNEDRLDRFRKDAYRSAIRYELSNVTLQWDRILTNL